MPLTKEETETIIRIAKEFGAVRMWLFGSMADPNPEVEPRDIDLAVEGVLPERFYRFYGKLLTELAKPVDLVDMADDLPVVDDVKDKGVIIYSRRQRRKSGEAEKSRGKRKTASR